MEAEVNDQPQTTNKLFTIIRVKRKLNVDNSNVNDRFNSFKRLRHIGSFANEQSEETIAASNLLKQLGGGGASGELASKRIKFNDLNSEQLEAYVEKLDNNNNKKQRRFNSNSNNTDKNNENNDSNNNAENNNVTLNEDIKELKQSEDEIINEDISNNGIFDIGLEPEDLGTGDDNADKKPESASNLITCNGSVMEMVPSESNAERYVYDYYVLMDNLIDFENDQQRSADCYYDDGEDADSNDENYRYNDYPDENEFEDHSDEDYYDIEDRLSNYSEEDVIRDEDGNVIFARTHQIHRANPGIDDDDEDYYDESEDLCSDFQKLKFKPTYSDIGGDDDLDDSD